MDDTLPARNEVQSISREAPYAESVQRWEAFWSLEDLGRLLWMVPTSPVWTARQPDAMEGPVAFVQKRAPQWKLAKNRNFPDEQYKA